MVGSYVPWSAPSVPSALPHIMCLFYSSFLVCTWDPASLSAPHYPCVLRCHYELFQQNPIENIFTHQNEKLACNEVMWPLFGKDSHILPFFFRAFLISLPISDSARVGNLSIPKFWFTQFLNVNSTDK